MHSTANSQSRSAKVLRWYIWFGVLLAAAFTYIWLIPLFRPRGELLWGHYRLKDIYLGIPIALATLCVIVALVVPARYRRSLLLRLVTVIMATLVAFAICDAGYALGFMGALKSNYWLDQAHIPRKYSAADNELGFVRKPGVSWRGYVRDVNRVVEYRTDENGFRNSPGQRQADVVFIGDSFTEAATVPEELTFVKRVAQATGLSTVNLGRGAYGPQQELIVLKRYGLSHEPRFVVWQLFEGNDLYDAEAFAGWLKNPEQVSMSLKDRYFSNSLLREWLINTRSKDSDINPIATLQFHDGTARASLVYRYDPQLPSVRRQGMSETMSAIEAGYRLCESRGIHLLVVSVPTMVRVMAPRINFDHVEDQKRFLPPKERDDEKDFSGTIEEFCARIGCTFVDSFAALRQAIAGDNSRLYIPNNEHLDLAGHDVISEIIADWLRSKSSNPGEGS